jgi:uncharacterized membrane protein YoaK (UPF0700 family)
MLPIGLALIAGYVDAYAILALGTFVSFMSGNTTRVGIASGQWKLAAVASNAVAIACFVLGAFTGIWLSHAPWRRARQLLFAIVAALLGIVIAARGFDSLPSDAAIAILSVAMGMMNTTVTHVGPERVSLTYVTGTLSRIGRHLALAARRSPLPDRHGPSDSHVLRAGLLACVWAGFFVGAVLAAVASAHLGIAALLAPFAALAALAVWSGGDRDEGEAP